MNKLIKSFSFWTLEYWTIDEVKIWISLFLMLNIAIFFLYSFFIKLEIKKEMKHQQVFFVNRIDFNSNSKNGSTNFRRKI